MKKIIILLLVAAAGTAAYFLFFKKGKSTPATSLKIEMLTGKWKLDSVIIHQNDSITGPVLGLLGMIDSNFHRYIYDVRNDGTILETLPGGTPGDTTYFDLKSDNEILVRQKLADTLPERYIIKWISNDSLVLANKDSTSFIFTK